MSHLKCGRRYPIFMGRYVVFCASGRTPPPLRMAANNGNARNASHTSGVANPTTRSKVFRPRFSPLTHRDVLYRC